jgi:hypothetical protein
VPRCSRSLLAKVLHAGALASALAFSGGDARSQQAGSRIGDADTGLLAPTLDSNNPQNPPRFRATRKKEDAARFGQLPSWQYEPGSGAGSTGFDSSNGGLRKSKTASKSGSPTNPTKKPAAPISKPPTRPGSEGLPPPQPLQLITAPMDSPISPRLLQPATAPLLQEFKNNARPGAPPPGPDASTVTVATVPPLWRPLQDPRPFDPTGIQIGAFNFRPAMEYSRGYDTNPARLGLPPISGSWFNLYAPEFLMSSNWGRHELTGYLRGSYMSFDTAHPQDRPNVDGKLNGRIDLTSLSRIDLEGRFILGTDYPGSPNIQAGLAHLPIFTTVGGSAGFGQRFNRFDITFKGGVDRTVFQKSVFVDGETESNDDRNFNQYSTSARATYELSPDIRPFAEVAANRRQHDLALDRFGLERDSDGYTAKAGATLNLAGTLTGDFAVGYLNQMYRAPLPNVGGYLVEAALVWQATALTTGRLFASTTAAESPLFLTSAVLTRQLGVEVNHAFRRWLIATTRFTVAHDIYAGDIRRDDRYAVSAALSYLLTRELALKGEYRYEWEHANVPGSNYVASIWLVGVRLQR